MILKRLSQFFSEHKYENILTFAVLLYIVYFTTASFLRHDNFYSGKYDLGNMDQVVWNTAKGRTFAITDENGTRLTSRLTSHADFILILLAPLYWLWESPKMLLFTQSLVLGAGALFVFFITNHIIGNKSFAILFSVAYLLNPSLQRSNLYDFHAVTFATTFLLGSFYFLVKRKYGITTLFLFLAGITKEQVWIIVALFGLYMTLLHRKIRLGITIFVVGLSIFYALVWHIIPAFRGKEHFALEYYNAFGSSPSEIVVGVMRSPLKTLSVLVEQGRPYYLLQLFLPMGFLSLLQPQTLIFALPDFIINLLSNNTQLHQIYFHYTATITPFLFISAIYGMKKLHLLFPKLQRFALCYLLFAICYGAYAFGPLPLARSANIDMFTKKVPHRSEITRALSKIPQDVSVAATNNIGAHLSHREKIYTIPTGVDKAHVLVFLLTDQSAQPSLAAQKEMVEKLKQDDRFKLHEQVGEEFFVFYRAPSSLLLKKR